MAGSRERSGRPRRPAAREQRMRARLAEVRRDIRRQLWISFDWWRIEAGDDEGELREVGEWLANRALQLGRRRR
jgi:hypothetical protein